jgi:prepilin-type N-terminal cleavage/methylation domain-containing protein
MNRHHTNARGRLPQGVHSRGFTLTELLVTISIAAFLLLAGVGLYWRMNRGFALRAAISHLESALRGARAFAVHERSPAQVILVTRGVNNPTDHFAHQVDKLYALGKRTVSCWHLEPSQLDGSSLKGALDQTAEPAEGGQVQLNDFVQGKIGQCLRFGSDGAGAIRVSSPYLDEIREGVFAEAYVKPDAADLSSGSELTVVSKGEAGNPAFALWLTYQEVSGRPLFQLHGQVRTAEATVHARTDAIIRNEEWAHVSLDYNPHRDRDVLNSAGVVLRVDGREVALFDDASGDGVVASSPGPMRMGSGFQGCIDQVKIAALVATEVRRLPRNTEVLVDPGVDGDGWDGRIHFDDEGKLDRRIHGRIVRFLIVSPADRLRRTVQVNWLGGVEVGEQEREVDEET